MTLKILLKMLIIIMIMISCMCFSTKKNELILKPYSLVIHACKINESSDYRLIRISLEFIIYNQNEDTITFDYNTFSEHENNVLNLLYKGDKYLLNGNSMCIIPSKDSLFTSMYILKYNDYSKSFNKDSLCYILNDIKSKFELEYKNSDTINKNRIVFEANYNLNMLLQCDDTIFNVCNMNPYHNE